MFGNLTPYVTKAVEQAQAQLEENGQKIIANNPPLTINLVRHISLENFTLFKFVITEVNFQLIFLHRKLHYF